MIQTAQRTVEIRRALRRQYQQGAVNEGLVARLTGEMRGLRHQHEYTDGIPELGLLPRCMWCGQGRAR